MLMEYINGTTAMDLHERKDCAPFAFRIEEQNTRLGRQVARVQVELARCRFDGIGSLQYDEKDDAIHRAEIADWTGSLEIFIRIFQWCS